MSYHIYMAYRGDFNKSISSCRVYCPTPNRAQRYLYITP